MATLEDVRRYVGLHADEAHDRLLGHVAREFGMTHAEAVRMLDQLAAERDAEGIGDLRGRVVGAEEVLAGLGEETNPGVDVAVGSGWQGAGVGALGATALGDRARDDDQDKS